MDSKLEQAREYAQWVIDNTPGHHQSKARAAAEVIQSLPDRIVDGDRLRQIIDFQGSSISEEARKDLESLIPPCPPRPEDVPAGEPWLVKYDGREWVGIRSDHDFRPWSIICMDGAGDLAVNDSDITLVSRLVPENKENA